MRPDKIFSCLLLLLVARAALADSDFSACSTPPAILIDELGRTACEFSRSVTIERYSSSKPASLYANDFDRREVVIASGKTVESVRAVAGIRIRPSTRQVQTDLLHPPFADQIAKRYPLPKASRYGRWVIAYEQIEYGAQGSAQRFPLECATAIRSTTRATEIVAECSPLGERARFSKTLDAIQRPREPGDTARA